MSRLLQKAQRKEGSEPELLPHDEIKTYRVPTASEVEKAMTFLKAQLADGESKDSENLIALAIRAGISKEAVWQASRELGVIGQKDDDTGKWLWSWVDMSGIEFPCGVQE